MSVGRFGKLAITLAGWHGHCYHLAAENQISYQQVFFSTTRIAQWPYIPNDIPKP
jgi:hypothetical protein|tara:strand:+ start:637 stop:801 length:165 start_codon:yes stop_codon:yes gene_type:complete